MGARRDLNVDLYYDYDADELEARLDWIDACHTFNHWPYIWVLRNPWGRYYDGGPEPSDMRFTTIGVTVEVHGHGELETDDGTHALALVLPQDVRRAIAESRAKAKASAK